MSQKKLKYAARIVVNAKKNPLKRNNYESRIHSFTRIVATTCRPHTMEFDEL